MHSLIHQRSKGRSGFTLTELAIVLGVVGAFLSAVWLAATNVQNNSRANQAVQDIMTIAANVRSTFMAANAFSVTASTDEVANGNFITANIIPSDLVTSATSATNAWGGTVRVYENPTGSNQRLFRVSYYGLPLDACFRVVSQIVSLGTSDGPITLTTNSGSYAVAIPNTGSTIGLSSAAITTACSKTSAGASIEFDFTIH